MTALTRIQRLLWAGQELHRGVPLYNMALAFEFDGSLNIAHLERALQSVIERADALRTVFRATDGTPSRHVLESSDWRLRTVDLSADPDPQSALRSWLEDRVQRCFDLADPPFDTVLLKLAPERHVWYVNQHHLITDGWSTALLYREVAEAYRQARTGELPDAPALPSYEEHVAVERSIAGSGAHTKASEHWRSQLANIQPVPLYGKRTARQNTSSERRTVPLSAEQSSALRALAQRPEASALTNHLSQFNVFAATLFAFLHRVSGESRFAIAAPAHNRRSAKAKATLGVFIEVFPLGVRIDPDDTFADLLRRTSKAGAGFVRHALPGASPPGLNRSCNVVLNYIPASFPDFDGLETRSEWLHPGHADLAHDVRLQVHDFDETGEFVLHFDLSTERFDADERDSLVSHFLNLLQAFVDDPDQLLGTPSLADSAEQARLLEGVSTGGEPVSEGTVVDRFEATVANTPDRTAVVCGDVAWSYRDLHERADRIARHLVARGAAEGTVGLVATRHPEILAAILGTLKAGAAYVPLDPSHPADRLRFMLSETEPAVVLARDVDSATLPNVGVTPVSLDSILADSDSIIANSSEQGADEVLRLPSPDDLAYVLYTSGSTGRPKGVRVTHRSLVTYSDWAARTYWEDAPLSVPLFTPLTFDLTITSMFAPLLAGGCIVVYPSSDSDIDSAFLDVLEEDRVDIVKLTPAHLALLRGRDLSGSRIRTLVVGGADLRTDVALAAWQTFAGQVTIYNEYGPTEATVGCMFHRYDPEAPSRTSVPIGRAAAGARIYVVDESARPVPDGIVGEIVVGGAGVSLGYLDRPVETAERFVEDPARPGEMAYRTGDLGRSLPDGTIEFVGRNDRQAKVHGIRVEPGEVEAAIANEPGIDACVVDYVEATGHEEPDFHCLRCGLASNYPDVSFDEVGICSVCRTFEQYEQRAFNYFQPMDRLREIFEAEPGPGEFDCIVLYSGGKDSTFALYGLADMGLRILTLTLDNGFISDGAKANIRRVVEALGVAHEYVSTPAMNEVFVDSLQRHSNVCNGCFKVLYTLAANVALERRIPFVVTGLSRGQFFETRLTEELFLDDRYETDDIDALVVDARRAYHRVDDAVRRRLDTSAFDDDAVFDRVRFLDFYRYCDVELSEVLEFLGAHAAWIRPADTGRSTNCLINDVGIYVHQRERGHHNYARPYSWDVRLGHKERDAALDELNDEIDEPRVRKILAELGYTPAGHEGTDRGGRLVGYIVASHELDLSELRSSLRTRLPSYMIPADIVQIHEVPLTSNGKVDYEALPRPQRVPASAEVRHVAPRDEKEKWFTEAWSRVLRRETIGIHDSLFDLGGDSIAVIQIAAQAAEAGFAVDPSLMFQFPTIAELAARVGERRIPIEAGSEDPSSDSLSGVVDNASRAKVIEQLRRAEQKLERDGPEGSSGPSG